MGTRLSEENEKDPSPECIWEKGREAADDKGLKLAVFHRLAYVTTHMHFSVKYFTG